MVAGIVWVQSCLISSWMQFWFVSAIPECLNCHILKGFVPILMLCLCPEFLWWDYAYFLQHFCSLIECIQFPKLIKYLNISRYREPWTTCVPCHGSAGYLLSLWRPMLNSRPFNMECVVDKGTLGPGFLRACRFSPASIFASAPFSFVHLLLII